MEHMAQLLPDDVLADVLRRLGPHGLAASRCVCKAWRAVIDAHRLLPADPHLLPLSMAGFFASYKLLPVYFARPSSSRIAAKLDDYLDPRDDSRFPNRLRVIDHCNGLLLLDNNRVLNPATGQWAWLPPKPHLTTPGLEDVIEQEDAYLVFDPTVSPHYEVFFFNSVRYWTESPEYFFDDKIPPAKKELEWPPSPYVLRVFSSRTRRWEEKPFIREGGAAGTIGHMQSASSPGHSYAAYWRRALYVHQHDFVIRVNLSNDKYQAIMLPKGNDAIVEPDHYIGKSEKGVYCSLHDGLRLWVWFLDESCGQMEWMLKHDISLEPLLANFPWKYGARPWLVQYITKHQDEDVESEEAPIGEELEWDYSNNDNAIVAEDRSVESYRGYTISDLLGFHPYKEIVFFRASFGRVAAYHFNSFKIEDLGYLPLKEHGDLIKGPDFIWSSFPYTPCRMGELSDK